MKNPTLVGWDFFIIGYDVAMATSQRPRVWGREITDKHLTAVLDWCVGKLNLVELMKLTGTNTSSVYSLIARGSRLAIERGILKRAR